MGFTTGQKSESTPEAKWFPGQQEYIPEFMKPFQDIYSGGMGGSPLARIMSSLALQSGTKEAGAQSAKIAGTRGMTAPAKAKAVRGVGEAAVTGAAGAPMTAWSEALNTLRAYALQTPVVGNISSASGGGGMGLCTCENLREFNEGELVESLRRFRDEHYDRFGDVALGYKVMARWFVPLIRQYRAIKFVSRILLFFPLVKYVEFTQEKNHYGLVFFWIGKFWDGFWRFTGRREREHDLLYHSNL